MAWLEVAKKTGLTAKIRKSERIVTNKGFVNLFHRSQNLLFLMHEIFSKYSNEN